MKQLTVHDLGFAIGERYHITSDGYFDRFRFTPLSDETKSIILKNDSIDKVDIGDGRTLRFRICGCDLVFVFQPERGPGQELICIIEHPLELRVGETYKIDWTHLGTAYVRCSAFLMDCPEMSVAERGMHILHLVSQNKQYVFWRDHLNDDWSLISVMKL